MASCGTILVRAVLYAEHKTVTFRRFLFLSLNAKKKFFPTVVAAMKKEEESPSICGGNDRRHIKRAPGHTAHTH